MEDPPGQHNIIFSNAARFTQTLTAQNHLRLLAVLAAPIANPSGNGLPDGRMLDVWGEWERLCQATNRAHAAVSAPGIPWAVVRLVPPTAEELRDILIQQSPGYQVVHISCHGIPDGLMLEDKLGRERLIPTAELVDIFRGSKRSSSVRLVVLNACESIKLAHALVKQAGVATVIATRRPISDSEAKLLSERLYRWLAAGATVFQALEEARRAIVEQGSSGELAVIGDARERADNLVLIGKANLRFKTEVSGASEPCFVPYPVPYDTLPSPSHLFIGRISEQQRIARWFNQTNRRAFVISGLAGVGKTALALNVAFRHAYQFRALAWVSAKDEKNVGALQVLRALNTALGIVTAPETEQDFRSAITRRLNSKPVLLILDNLENVSPNHMKELARALDGLDPTSGSRVMMTTRVDEDNDLMSLANDDRLVLRALDRASAVRLAWEEISSREIKIDQHGFDNLLQPTDKNKLDVLAKSAHLPNHVVRAEVAALNELAHFSFDYPSIIKLAVIMISKRGLNRTLRCLESLDGRDVELALENMIGQTLRDLLDHRLEQTPDYLAVLHTSLTFFGGAEEGRLRTVVTQQQVHDNSSEAIHFRDYWLQPLETACLLIRNGTHYELEPPVRAYLEHKHPPEEQVLANYKDLHAAVHLGVVGDYEKALTEGRMTYNNPLEWGNVVAALNWLARKGPRDRQAARLLLAYISDLRNIFCKSYDPHHMRWLEAARLAAENLGSIKGQATVLGVIGDVVELRGEYETALSFYNKALMLSRTAGSTMGEANALWNIGSVQQILDQCDAALSNYNDALALFRAAGDLLGQANVIYNIGGILKRQKEFDKALSNYEEALPLYRAEGNWLGEANIYKATGNIYQSREEFDAAIENYQSALTLYRSIGFQLGEAGAHQSIGDVYVLRKEYDAALRSYQEALTLCHTVGSRIPEAHVHRDIGNLWKEQKELESALESYEAALVLYKEAGNRIHQAHIYKAIGDIQILREKPKPALENYQAALAIYRAMHERLKEAQVLSDIGIVLKEHKRRKSALNHLEAALKIYREEGNQWGEAHLLHAIGDVQMSRAESEAALSNYSAALALHHKNEHQSCEARIYKSMGDVQRSRNHSDDALTNYKTALDVYRHIGDRSGEASIHRAIAKVQQSQRRLIAARTSYETALRIYHDLGDRSNEAHVLREFGDMQYDWSEYKKALKNFESALTLYCAVGDHWEEAHILHNIGNVHFALTKYNLALIYYQPALALHHENKHRSCEARVLLDMGNVYRLLSRIDDALTSYNASLELYHKTGNRWREANVLTAKGLLLIAHDPIQSGVLLDRAQSLRRAIKDIHGIGADLRSYGIELLRHGRREEALSYFQQARSFFDTHQMLWDVRILDQLIARTQGWRYYVKFLFHKFKMGSWWSETKQMMRIQDATDEEVEAFLRATSLSGTFKRVLLGQREIIK